MNKELLQKYAELKQKEKEISKTIKELAPFVLEEMVAEGADKIESPVLGIFLIERRKDWKYSLIVENAEAKVKELRLDEQARGKATYTERSILKYFNPSQNNGEEI